MTGIEALLARAWVGLATHLWQTSLVVIPLIAIGQLMRNAPHRLTSAIAWLALAKLLLPVSLLAPFVSAVAAPLLDRTDGLVRASGLLYPGVLADATAVPQTSWQLGLLMAVTSAWAAGAIWFGVRPWIRRPAAILRTSVSIDSLPEAARTRLSAALQLTGISLAGVRIVPGAVVPCAVGIWRRRIVLPVQAAAELPAEELRGILLHEQAHVRRLDPLVDVVLGAAAVAFYFYPPLWLISKWLRESAEYACDEAAVLAGVGPDVLTRAVARTLSLQVGMVPGRAVAALGRSSSLKARFKRLDEPWRYVTMTRHRVVLVLAVVSTVILSIAVALAARTAGETPDPGSTPATEPVRLAQGEPPQPPPPEDPVADLDAMPEVIPDSYVAPQYPENAKKAGVDGRVMLNVFVRADGTVGEPEVIEGVAGYPELGTNAVAAVRQWKFKPATKDGKAVGVWVKIPVAYALSEEKKSVPRPSVGLQLQADQDGKERKVKLTERNVEIVKESYVTPDYPEDALKAGVGGKVLLEVEVLKNGTVGKASVKEGVPGYPSLAESAVAAVGKWRFTPAAVDGQPVDITIIIPVEFRLDGMKAPGEAK